MTDEYDMGPVTGQTPALFEIHRPREGRLARNWGVFFGGLALLLAAVIGVPALVLAGRHQDHYNRELSCRAKVNNATTAVNAAIILAFTDLSLSTAGSTERQVALRTLTLDRARATQLFPIQQDVVGICRAHPDYQLPPGGTP